MSQRIFINGARLLQSISYLSLVVAGSVMPSGSAVSQEQGYVLDEVIVTARKREETLMETPISITVFSSQVLDSMNFASIDEIGTQTPNMVFSNSANISGSSNASAVYMRGIGQSDYTLAVEPGVGIYIDDVYLPHSIGNVVNIVDVERIEILRGPQGTLFGRNTIGGAIRVVTEKPHDEFEAKAEFITGSYNRIDLRGIMNVPLREDLFVRISGLSQDRDGFVDRPFLSGKTGDKNSSDLIAQARWLATDNLTADLKMGFSRADPNGAPNVILDAELGVGTHGQWATNTAPFVDPNQLQGLLLGPDLIGFGPETGCCITYSDTDIDQRFESYNADLTLNWNVNENLSFRSITAYHTVDANFGRDSDGAPFVQEVELYFSVDYDVWSQEFQLTGEAFADQMDWLVGVYYFYEDGIEDDFVPFGTFDLKSGGLFETEDYAAFAQATFDVTDQLSLTAGVRYTDEEKTSSWDGVNYQAVIAGFTSPTEPFKNPINPPIPTVPVGTYTDTIEEWTPYANVSYQWTDAFLTYVTYSEGFKGGGVQVRNGPLEVVPRFGPEFIKAYEVGGKWGSDDNRFSVTAAAFFNDYTDLQIAATILAGGVANSRVTNAGDAEMKGFEFEAQASPTNDVSLNFGVSYLDAKYTELIEGSSVSLDSELPYGPDWQLNASASYVIKMDYGQFIPRVDVGYTTEYFNEFSNSELSKHDDLTMLNLAVGFDHNEGQWSAALFLHNALDEQTVIAGFDGFPAGGGYADGVISRPREWGMKIAYSF